MQVLGAGQREMARSPSWRSRVCTELTHGNPSIQILLDGDVDFIDSEFATTEYGATKVRYVCVLLKPQNTKALYSSTRLFAPYLTYVATCLP